MGAAGDSGRDAGRSGTQAAWYVFTHPKAHKVYPDWVNVAD